MYIISLLIHRGFWSFWQDRDLPPRLWRHRVAGCDAGVAGATCSCLWLYSDFMV